MTHLDLDRIEGLAKAATPGPWHLWRKGSQRVEDDRGLYVAETGPYDEKGHTAAYLVAVQPSTVLDMITRIRELEGALEPFVKMAEGEPDTIMLRTDGPWFRRARTALQRKTP